MSLRNLAVVLLPLSLGALLASSGCIRPVNDASNRASTPQELTPKPCTLLTKQLVSQTLKLAPSVKLQGEKSEGPVCTYAWSDAVAPARKTVSLTVASTTFDSNDEARRAFDATQKMINAAAAQPGQGTAAKSVPIAGVGDQAAWQAEKSDLAVLHGESIFHVTATVHTSSSANLAAAKKLAHAVLGKL